MKTSKLFSFLNEFSRGDFIKFGEFINSPYHNKLNELVRFYEALKKHYPTFSSKNCSAEKVFVKVYPTDNFDYGRYRVLSSRMLSLAKRFIAVNELENNITKSKLAVIRSVRSEKNKNIYNESIKELERLLTENKLKDEHHFHRMHELQYYKNISSDHFSGKIDYNAEAYNIMIYTIARVLKIYSSWINTYNSINIPVNTALLEKIEGIIADEPYKSNPVISINYNILQFAKDFTNEKYFFEHLRLTDKYPDAISGADLYDTYVLLLNFCAVKNMHGDKTYNGHKFELYKKMLSKKLFFINSEFIPYEMYNNIVGSAIETGNMDWASGFIERYKNNLSEEHRDDIFHLSLAKINFAKGNYEETIKNTSALSNIENPFYKFAVKELVIKAYYELGYYENILSLIDSYKHMLSKTKLLNKDMRESRKAFLNGLNTFIKYRIDNEKGKLTEFYQSLKNSEHFVQKEWIMEKLREAALS